MTLTVVMVTLLLSLTQGLVGNFNRTKGNMVRQADASFALDQLILDLEGISIPNAAGAEALRMTPETVGNAETVWLTFLSTAIDRDNSTTNPNIRHEGASRAISYRMALQNTLDEGADHPDYALYRSIASAKHTFENALNTLDLQEDYWEALPAAPEPTPAPPTTVANFLAGNVVGLSIRFLGTPGDSQAWTQPDQFIRIGSDGFFVSDDETFSDNEKVEGGFRRAEVAITTLSPEGSAKLRTGGLSFEDAVRQFGRTSVRQTADLNLD